MKQEEIDAICARVNLDIYKRLPGEPEMVIICVDPLSKQPIYLDDLPADLRKRFEERAQSVGQAAKDRADLFKWCGELMQVVDKLNKEKANGDEGDAE